MLCVHALVAEDAADLVHTLDAADNKAFEIKFGRYTQEHVDIQRIVMRYERTCGRAAGDGVKYGSFDLHVASAVEERADIAYEFRADLKIAAAVIAHDEVNIALAVFKLGAGHAVELLGQRTQALGEQRDRLDMHGNFLGLGLENEARNADYIADIVLAEVCKLLFGHRVLADVQLNRAAVILDVAEYCLTHAAL